MDRHDPHAGHPRWSPRPSLVAALLAVLGLGTGCETRIVEKVVTEERWSEEPRLPDPYRDADVQAPGVLLFPGPGIRTRPLDLVIAASEPATIRYRLDEGPEVEVESPVVLPDLAASFTLSVTAVDPAGNASPVRSARFTLVPPVGSIAGRIDAHERFHGRPAFARLYDGPPDAGGVAVMERLAGRLVRGGVGFQIEHVPDGVYWLAAAIDWNENGLEDDGLLVSAPANPYTIDRADPDGTGVEGLEFHFPDATRGSIAGRVGLAPEDRGLPVLVYATRGAGTVPATGILLGPPDESGYAPFVVPSLPGPAAEWRPHVRIDRDGDGVDAEDPATASRVTHAVDPDVPARRHVDGAVVYGPDFLDPALATLEGELTLTSRHAEGSVELLLLPNVAPAGETDPRLDPRRRLAPGADDASFARLTLAQGEAVEPSYDWSLTNVEPRNYRIAVAHAGIPVASDFAGMWTYASQSWAYGPVILPRAGETRRADLASGAGVVSGTLRNAGSAWARIGVRVIEDAADASQRWVRGYAFRTLAPSREGPYEIVGLGAGTYRVQAWSVPALSEDHTAWPQSEQTITVSGDGTVTPPAVDFAL